MALMFPFAVGARTVLFPEHPTPARLFELVERFRPTVLATVPTMTAKLLAAPDAGARDLSSLRLAVTAGEALPPELHRRWLEAFGVEMLDGIGSAEMFHIYISNRRGAVRAGSLGQVVPGYEARVVRPDGGDAPDGEPGTLWVRGDSMLSGYHDDPGKTAATLRDGWVVSGDVFRREGGHFFYEGRADDMLKVGGIYVSPLEVEHALAAHPSVVECAVVGYEDGDGLTKARAFVAFRPDAPGDDRARFAELAAWARARLARYKVPRDWVACAALPRNDRGKIVRRALRGG
jgi:acyl-coenzyme A synthetase/AMP-(fatty) acid ligase